MRGVVKKLTAFALTCLMLFTTSAPFAFAEGKPSFSLGVTAFPNNDKTAVDLWFDEADGKLWLFLPAGSDPSSLKVRLSGADSASVDGRTLTNGSETDAFAIGDHSLTCGGGTYPLTVLRSSELPSVFLETESGSLEKIHASKDNREPGRVTVIENGAAVIDNAELASVKGRGNSTWSADKKPYNIKFDKKTDVLGMGRAKKWSLLANHYDASLLRNSFALDLADAFGLPFTPSYRMVDLYANGEYQGNYLITESVETGETRVAIADLEDANEEANPGADAEKAAQKSAAVGGRENARKWADLASPQDVSGGYLLETEFPSRYGNEVSGFITPHGQHMVLKSPEYASREEVEYIAEFYEAAERALYSPDGRNAEGKHWSDYFDTDQLVKMYVLTEYTCHRDAGMSSCYFYKDAGDDVLHAGPAWDFDLSMGNSRFNAKLPFDAEDPGTWWANSLFCLNADDITPTVFTLLYRHEDFRALVSERWAELSKLIDSELEELPRMTDRTAPSAVMNAFRWRLHSAKTPDKKETSYRNDVEILKKFTAARREVLDKGFGPDAAMVYYDANGGGGAMYNGAVLSVGDPVVLRSVDDKVTPLSAPEGFVFAGWNTRADGSGVQYKPGNSVRLDKKTTVFYARWRPENSAPPTEEDDWYPMGDLDLDARITAADARTALRASANLTALDTLLQELGDVSGDGRITASDARSILRASADLDVLPSQTVFIPSGHERPF